MRLAGRFRLALTGCTKAESKTGPEFEAFIAKAKAFISAHATMDQATEQEAKDIVQAAKEEATREAKIDQPNFAQLSAAEQDSTVNNTMRGIVIYLTDKSIQPKDYFTPSLPVPEPASDSNEFLAQYRAFYLAHPDPAKFTIRIKNQLEQLLSVEVAREAKLAHPNYEQLPRDDRQHFLGNYKAILWFVLGITTPGYSLPVLNEYLHLETPTPSATPQQETERAKPTPTPEPAHADIAITSQFYANRSVKLTPGFGASLAGADVVSFPPASERRPKTG
jgi:hypothetical protein